MDKMLHAILGVVVMLAFVGVLASAMNLLDRWLGGGDWDDDE